MIKGFLKVFLSAGIPFRIIMGIFKSHSFNIQTHETVIGLEQVAEIKTVNNLGLIPNGLKIVTNNGVNEKFVVNNRKTWIKQINAAIFSVDN